VAALMGVPTPYASVGRVSHGLWHLRGCSSGNDAQSCRQRYAATLQANAWQVCCSRLLQYVFSLHTGFQILSSGLASSKARALPQSCSTPSQLLAQVQRYLQAYAASDGGNLPTAELAHSQALYAAAKAAGKADAGSREHVSR
jgi:hypothetical protein